MAGHVGGYPREDRAGHPFSRFGVSASVAVARLGQRPGGQRSSLYRHPTADRGAAVAIVIGDLGAVVVPAAHIEPADKEGDEEQQPRLEGYGVIRLDVDGSVSSPYFLVYLCERPFTVR